MSAGSRAEEHGPAGTLPAGAAAVVFVRSRLWIAGWWAAGRAVVFGAVLAVHAAHGPTGFLSHEVHGHPLAILGGWDGRWYRMVAESGYLLVPGRQSDPAFFPLYPVLLRAVHGLGIGYTTAGPLLSTGALLGALVAFHALSRDLFGETFARRAAVYAAIFPLGTVFSMTYPESLVLAALALAGLAALRERWWLAGACAAAAALARPEGVFVALPIAAAAWQARGRLSPSARGGAFGAALAPAAALASFPLYLATVLHDPLAWTRAERAWGRHFSPIGFVAALRGLPAELARNPWLVRDVVALAVYLVLLVAARRAGTPLPWLLAGLAVVVLPIFSGSFESIGRFGLLVPPLFWGLARLTRGRRADTVLRIASLALLAAATVATPYVFP